MKKFKENINDWQNSKLKISQETEWSLILRKKFHLFIYFLLCFLDYWLWNLLPIAVISMNWKIDWNLIVNR